MLFQGPSKERHFNQSTSRACVEMNVQLATSSYEGLSAVGLTGLERLSEQPGHVFPVNSMSLKTGRQEAFVAWSQTECQTY